MFLGVPISNHRSFHASAFPTMKTPSKTHRRLFGVSPRIALFALLAGFSAAHHGVAAEPKKDNSDLPPPVAPIVDAAAPETKEKKDPNAPHASRRDTRFVLGVLKINHDEVVIAQLVAERATTREIKLLSRQLISDLDLATRDLRALAEREHVTLPEPRSESGDLKTWNEKSPSTLDAQYLRRAQDVLEDLNDLYAKAATRSDSAEISAFAQKMLPAIKEQRDRANQTVLSAPEPSTPPATGVR